MKRKLFYLFFLLAISAGSNAQTWNPVSTGIEGSGANTTWSLLTFDSVLYAGGWFDTAGGVVVKDVAQWNGINWASIGTGSSGYINAMIYYNGNIYAGGYFDTIGGIVAHSIAMWNGTNWAPVSSGVGIKTQEYGVFAMAVYNGELYIGGSFDSIDGKQIFGIAKWNGVSWSSVGTGIYAADEDDGVFALTVYNGELYAAGGIDSAGGVPVSEVAKWNGTNWSAVGSYTNGPMYALAVYGGNLYVGGWADTIGGIFANSVAMWNGTNFAPLDSGLYGEPGGSQLSALTVYNGVLYAGGYFDSVNGKAINCIAQWNGKQWSSVGNVNNGGVIDAMVVYNNSLYVAGGFDSVGGVYAKNIAMLTTPNSVSEINRNMGINIYPNPAHSVIYLSTTIPGIVQYAVYNSLGELIETYSSSSVNNVLDISTYPVGIYLVTVIANGQLYSSKFVKE